LAVWHRLASGLVRPRLDTHRLRSSSDRRARKCGESVGWVRRRRSRARRAATGRTYCSIVSGVMRLRCGTAWRWPSRARARAAAASGTLARVDSTSWAALARP